RLLGRAGARRARREDRGTRGAFARRDLPRALGGSRGSRGPRSPRGARMTAPALGIGYSLWLRGRFALGAAWSVVFALAAAVKLVPMFTAPIAVGAGLELPLSGVVFAALAVLVPVLALLNVLTYGPIDVSATDSPMPIHVRILPLSNRA